MLHGTIKAVTDVHTHIQILHGLFENVGKEQLEQDLCQDVALFHPIRDFERTRPIAIEEYLSFHAIMEKPDD